MPRHCSALPRTPADAFSSAVQLPAVHLSPSSCAALHGAHEARQAAASMLPCHGMQQALLTNISKRNQTGHNEGRLCRREGGLHLTKEKDIWEESARSGMWNVSAQQSDKTGQSPAAVGRRWGGCGQSQHGSSTQHHTHTEVSCCSAQRCHLKPMCWSPTGRLETWKWNGKQSSMMRGTGSPAPPGEAFCHSNCKLVCVHEHALQAHQGHQHQVRINCLNQRAAPAQHQVHLWRAQAQLWAGHRWDLTSLTGLWLCTLVYIYHRRAVAIICNITEQPMERIYKINYGMQLYLQWI